MLRNLKIKRTVYCYTNNSQVILSYLQLMKIKSLNGNQV